MNLPGQPRGKGRGERGLMSGSRNSSHSKSAQRKSCAHEICVLKAVADLRVHHQSKRGLQDNRGGARMIHRIRILLFAETARELYNLNDLRQYYGGLT